MSIKVPGDRFQADGANLPQVLLKLKLEQDEAFSDIREILSNTALIGTGLKLSIRMGEGLAVLSLRHESGNELFLRDWPDGWKSFLLLLVALRTVRDGSLIFIEEPESHLHASLLSSFINQVNLVIERGGQVIVSTHSVDLLNMLDDASCLRLLGDGSVQTPGPDLAHAVRESGMLLGLALRSGALAGMH